ncbi:protein adenylyltransferase Fic-like isoform X1 [Drosophila eugracilis]|uniref:protein adenylyltransferase Fic-like isoform X1 n=1 Tax=Drosophila eugracilis TaxID=29029 RepID=UPI001BDB4FF1|nr:protein adenylyltransferase Fic-like isoform X1 [Drosophila eugracilis]XP_041675298.1 protein adenylyltransferase Fic-like isoform X1 [Drosophila eugracilis]XP_041675299.1 protein adenylyltransferase Fic-like isoform X1 [Drosophila eugracilis]XP_041675300.1 protein adenylyltransferase Fic-like isoform X1 [Drosophila eugracilis]
MGKNATQTNLPAHHQQRNPPLYGAHASSHLRIALFFIAGSIAAWFFHIFTSSTWNWNLRQNRHFSIAHNHQTQNEFALYSVEEMNSFKEFYFKNIREDVRTISMEEEQTNIKEALVALQRAHDMYLADKIDKAGRLFEHALILAPRHPEVLLRYGEFLEHSQHNVVLADQYYFQALTINPTNVEAIANRQRTANVVQILDERRLESLDSKRDALSAIHETNAALRRAKKEAYFQHIYHSVGIEGNTMTLAQTRSVLETRMAVDGKSIDEHNEILGMDLAMKYINASLVQKIEITIKDILELHRRVLGHVDPIEGGEFRRTQVFVGGHIPPGPGDLSQLMLHFQRWINSDHCKFLHPVKFCLIHSYAALAHYKLVAIHPFIDGNGRTSRLLMNTLLMRAGYPPVIIPKQQRSKYYYFLKLANEGDIRPFVRFVADCTEKTLDLYLWATSDLPQQIPLLIQTENEADE